MADIITRLLLKTNDFDANLNKSKKSVNEFQGGISSMAQTAGAGVMKFAGFIGVAMGATEGFLKTMNSSQTTGDAFTRVTDQCKASVDSFFTSLSMGDFSGFLSNIGKAIQKAGDLSDALDELATKDLFSNSELNTLLLQKRIQENIAKDKTKSDAVRNEALEKARSIQRDINKLQSGLADTTKQAAYATLDSAIAKQGFSGNVSRDTWDWVSKESNRGKGLQFAENFKAQRAKGEIRETTIRGGSQGKFASTSTYKTEEYENYLKSRQGKFEEFMYRFYEMQDEEGSDLAAAVSLMGKANSMYGSVSDSTLQLNNIDAKINGSYESNHGGNGSGAGKPNIEPAKDSLAWYDAEITKLNKELVNATTMQARESAQAAIDSIQAQRDKLVFTEKYSKPDAGAEGRKASIQKEITAYDDAIAKRKEMLSINPESNEKVNAELKDIGARGIKLNLELMHSSKEGIEGKIKELEQRKIDLNASMSIKPTPAAEKEIDQINRQIAALEKSANAAKSREDIETELGELSQREIELKAGISTKSREEIEAEIKAFEDRRLELVASVKLVDFSEKVKKGEMPELDAPAKLSSKVDKLDTKKMKLPKIDSPIKKKDIALNEKYGESLSAIGDIMGNLSGAFDGNTASILQWGASLLGTIAQAIPAIAGMLPVKAADTAATNANTGAEVGNAMAKNMSAHSGIPFVGIAMGLAGVAAIIAAMSSIPKFAKGGIVSGRTLAEVGEYPGASSNPEVIAPLNKLRELIKPVESSGGGLSGEVRFKIKGADLEGALSNHTNRKSKVR